MNLQCPACSSAFSIPQAPSMGTVWCPYCGEKVPAGGAPGAEAPEPKAAGAKWDQAVDQGWFGGDTSQSLPEGGAASTATAAAGGPSLEAVPATEPSPATAATGAEPATPEGVTEPGSTLPFVSAGGPHVSPGAVVASAVILVGAEARAPAPEGTLAALAPDEGEAAREAALARELSRVSAAPLSSVAMGDDGVWEARGLSEIVERTGWTRAAPAAAAAAGFDETQEMSASKTLTALSPVALAKSTHDTIVSPPPDTEAEFFESEPENAPSVQRMVFSADDAEPPQRASNKPFLVAAGVVALAVGAFIVYLISTREVPAKEEKEPPAPTVTAGVAVPPPAPVPPLGPAAPPEPAPQRPVPAAPAGAAAPAAAVHAAPVPAATPAAPSPAPAKVEAVLVPALPKVPEPSPAAPPPRTEEPAPEEPAKAAAPEEPEEPPEPKTRPKAKPKKKVVRVAPAPRPVVEPEPAAPPAPAPPPPEDDARARAMARYRAGAALLVQGNFHAAIAEFQMALKVSDGLAEAHRGLGVAYSQLGRKAEAARHYQRYLRARPNAPDRDAIREALQDLGN
jgi:TolA-binding protein